MKLFLSAGHNVNDSGAPNPSHPELSEFKINRTLCEKIYENIKGKIQTVFVSDDINLSQTISFINANATSEDFAIEFHQNSASSASAHGAEIFYYGNSSVRKTQAENFLNMFLQDHPHFTNRGAKNDSLSFTKNTNCPALLFETGFLSNKGDSDYIVSNLDAIAGTLSSCILDLFNYVEVAPPPPIPEVNEKLAIIGRIETDLALLKQLC